MGSRLYRALRQSDTIPHGALDSDDTDNGPLVSHCDRSRRQDVYRRGEMAEWFKAAVLKTAERKLRGFESYSLRQMSCGEVAEWLKAAAC